MFGWEKGYDARDDVGEIETRKRGKKCRWMLT